jgi:hypothetical protein
MKTLISVKSLALRRVKAIPFMAMATRVEVGIFLASTPILYRNHVDIL